MSTINKKRASVSLSAKNADATAVAHLIESKKAKVEAEAPKPSLVRVSVKGSPKMDSTSTTDRTTSPDLNTVDAAREALVQKAQDVAPAEALVQADVTVVPAEVLVGTVEPTEAELVAIMEQAQVEKAEKRIRDAMSEHPVEEPSVHSDFKDFILLDQIHKFVFVGAMNSTAPFRQVPNTIVVVGRDIDTLYFAITDNPYLIDETLERMRVQSNIAIEPIGISSLSAAHLNKIHSDIIRLVKEPKQYDNATMRKWLGL